MTVLGNPENLVRDGHTFGGWNTAAYGGGTNYIEGATFTMDTNNVMLYAKWTHTYTVTYSGNTNTGGAVPVDANHFAYKVTFAVPMV